MTGICLIAIVCLFAPAVRAQDGWDTVPKAGDPDPFRPGEKAGPMPRTRQGKPDLSGIWQERTMAAWDVVKHRGDYGFPGGPGIIEGDKIPYRDGALKDSQPRCELPGVPRITYMPYAFEMVQNAGEMHVDYEYLHAWRIFHFDRSAHPEGVESFDGDSIAHWEGDTLVVDVKNLNDKTRLDMAGDFHSNQLHVVERYTPIDANTIWYEATLEDPKVYTRPWKLRLPLHRQAKNFELGEYECEGSSASGQLAGGAQ